MHRETGERLTPKFGLTPLLADHASGHSLMFRLGSCRWQSRHGFGQLLERTVEEILGKPPQRELTRAGTGKRGSIYKGSVLAAARARQQTLADESIEH